MQEGKKNDPEFVFCYWDEYTPNVEKNDSSSLQKEQDSKEIIHDSVRKRTNPGPDNKCESTKTPDSE
tara:strand:+ start:185 stop:385 length:201 start_codon:yes stop_codon:yes gene_type:complete